ADALRGNQVSFDYDAPHSLLAGETLSFHANYIPDLDNLGRVKGFYAITVDMTEHKRTQDALEFAMLEAEQANLSKSRFLAAASHDLRQPLQSMRLLLHTLENNDDPARQAQAIKGLSAAVSVTSTLLDALLDISKLDAGVIQPEMENVNIATMMEDMAARYQAQAEAWGVDLRTVSSSLMVHTDPVLLERVVGNFMSNALKFADGKKVLLGCRRRGDRLAIEVWDQGAGIPVEHQEKIFEEFYQFGRQRADTNKGLGLGLAIATRLSHLLDQPIDMRSTPGKGSMFSVTVPLSDTVIGVLNRAEQEAVA
ncbi:MAG: HAMP domain-containing sensor histidine kinase, partial [Alphaproteobacteria bacterium]|nr:HAMP domain-containing sensor histidine kinase [Alphaproteobacteria bacterium]